MSDIFLSYASADRERAQLLSRTLDRRGWSVWWDRTIPPGKEYDEVIEQALDSAKCVVVLWSTASVASGWVKTEAAEAMQRKILVPALIDGAKIPLEFRRLQAADLSHWHGEPSHPELQKFLRSVEVKIHGTAETVPEVQPVVPLLGPPQPLSQPARRPRATWPVIALISALVVIASGLMLWRSQADRASPAVPAQNVSPSDQAPVVPPSAADLPDPIPPPPAERNASVVKPSPISRRPPAPDPDVAKRPEPARPAPVAVEPTTPPESPTPPPRSTDLPVVSPESPKLPVQQFADILLVVTNNGETEELDAILVFNDSSLVLKDEDSNILRTLPYSNVQKATYWRTRRQIVFVRTTRHWLMLGTGGREVVLQLPDNYELILAQIEKHTGVTVSRSVE